MNLESTLLKEVTCTCSSSPEEGGFKLDIFSIAKNPQPINQPTNKTPNKTNKQPLPSHMGQVMLCYDDRAKEKKNNNNKTTPKSPNQDYCILQATAQILGILILPKLVSTTKCLTDV